MAYHAIGITCCSNNIVVLSLKSNHVVRIDLDNPADVDGVYCSSPSELLLLASNPYQVVVTMKVS